MQLTMQLSLALLFTALLFGGMMLYSFAFAAFLFKTLPAEQAGLLLRAAFPYFYAFVIVTAAIAALLHLGIDTVSEGLLLAVSLTCIPARQQLMPAINRATDAGETRLFKQLHTLSVLLTLLHIAAVGYALLRLV
ncbi:MAG: DUF4149 domain-containing protein [Congregibacter sp.]